MNEIIFYFFYNLSHQSIFFDRLVVFTADIFPYVVIISAGLFLLFHHEVFRAENPFAVFLQKKREISLVFFISIFAWLVARLLKIFIHIERPFVDFPNISPLFMETGFTMPSGHATFFMALAVSIFLSHKKAGYIFIFFALLIGLARIIAGVHFPIDILSGSILGGVIAYFFKTYNIPLYLCGKK